MAHRAAVSGNREGRAVRERARRRLYAGFKAPCNAKLAKEASQRPFGPENARKRRFLGLEMSRNGRVGPKMGLKP